MGLPGIFNQQAGESPNRAAFVLNWILFCICLGLMLLVYWLTVDVSNFRPILHIADKRCKFLECA